MHSGSVLESELDALESDRPFGNHLALFRECKLHFFAKICASGRHGNPGRLRPMYETRERPTASSSSSSFADTHAQCLPPLLLECDRERVVVVGVLFAAMQYLDY